MRSLTVSLVVLALAAVTFGCGDDSDATATALTKAEFSKKANAICDRNREKALSSTATTELAVIQESVLPAIQSSIDSVGALEAPQGDEAQVAALLESMQKAVDSGEQQQIASIGEIQSLFEKSGALAREYGVPGCAYG